jgi:hypothetical protein
MMRYMHEKSANCLEDIDMENKVMYNKYKKIFMYEPRGRMMTLESIFAHVKKEYCVKLLPEAHKSIDLINGKPFYVSPVFTEHNNDSGARIVLFSAPGATGKSALARYISYQYSSVYWNLADIHLGEKSFVGALVTALGSTEYSSYINALLQSQTLLVVDAFDESEVNSGENMVRSLISDMDNVLKECQKPYAAFFSRTETAQNIGEFLKRNNIPYVHYEIGLFSESQAKSFVKEYIIAKKGSCTGVQEDAITKFFGKIKNVMSDSNDYENFIGYAPVLQSIAITIMSSENTMTLLNNISNMRSVSIIREIMEYLISRENEKFVSNFITGVETSFEKIVETLSPYSSMEQFVRTLLFILDFPINYDDYLVEGMPDQLVASYEEKIKMFLPQHTFIMNTMHDSKKNYVGPAFRDYVIAHVILGDDYFDYANEYIRSNVSESHFPSQLFWDFYESNCDGKAKLIHLPYLYESYKSRNKICERSTLNITVHDGEGVAQFETFDVSKGEKIDSQTFELTGLDARVSFNKLNGVTIDGDVDVELHSVGPFVINDSSVDCHSLKIEAGQLEINSSEAFISYLISEESVEATKVPKINLDIKGSLYVSFPNMYSYHTLAPYKFDGTVSSQDGFESFAYNIKRIFSYFRQHKKDTLGKDYEKIDNHVLQNEGRQKTFDYLLGKSVIYREDHLYKVNKEKMKECGISWIIDSESAKKLYADFIEWGKTQ